MTRHNSLTPFLAIVSVLSIIAGGIAGAQEEDTHIRGRIVFDFPHAAEPKIEVNLSGSLFSLIAKSAKHEPEIAELVAMVEGIHVRGYENSAKDFDRMIRHYESRLKQEKWEVIAKVREKSETVQVRLLLDQDTVHGIFVIVASPTETMLVNIFGRIDFEKIGDLLGKLDEMNLDVDLHQLEHLKIDAASKEKAKTRRSHNP